MEKVSLHQAATEQLASIWLEKGPDMDQLFEEAVRKTPYKPTVLVFDLADPIARQAIVAMGYRTEVELPPPPPIHMVQVFLGDCDTQRFEQIRSWLTGHTIDAERNEPGCYRVCVLCDGRMYVLGRPMPGDKRGEKLGELVHAQFLAAESYRDHLWTADGRDWYVEMIAKSVIGDCRLTFQEANRMRSLLNRLRRAYR